MNINQMSINFLLPGIILGLTAGLSPGPLLTLVISETLVYGWKNGIKVSLAPLFTDIPIIITTFIVFNYLKSSDIILAFISIAGGIFLIYLGFENLKINIGKFNTKGTNTHSLRKAIIANVLSPHPYIFWMSVGGSFIVKGNIIESSLFLLGFYLLLIGSKISVALITYKSKILLESKYFVIIIRILGFILFGFSIILIKNGILYLIE
jgi:threonine/homoserine/homoserine lactone efflux protein